MPLLDTDFRHRSEGEPTSTEQVGMSDNESEDSEEPPARLLRRPRLNIDLEYQFAFDTYKKLKEQPDLLPDMPLNAVLAERYDENEQSYARARITSKGKITGRGPDFDSYLQIVNGTLDDYAKIVQSLESKYWMRLDLNPREDAIAISVKGQPFCIQFNQEIDVRRLINLMFDCSRPFRLMGEADEISKDYYAVEAIDLHVNQPVGFEIAAKFMRIYLYEGTCGNTLVRIIRSLQHSIDSKLRHPPLGN